MTWQYTGRKAKILLSILIPFLQGCLVVYANCNEICYTFGNVSRYYKVFIDGLYQLFFDIFIFVKNVSSAAAAMRLSTCGCGCGRGCGCGCGSTFEPHTGVRCWVICIRKRRDWIKKALINVTSMTRINVRSCVLISLRNWTCLCFFRNCQEYITWYKNGNCETYRKIKCEILSWKLFNFG